MWWQWLSLTIRLGIWTLILFIVLWAFGAIFYYVYLPSFLRIFVAFAFAMGAIYVFVRFKNRTLAKASIAVAVAIIFIAWLLIRPSLDRKWFKLHETVASISIVDDDVTIDNVRLAHYKTESDFTIEYQTRKFKLSQMEEVWFFVQRFTELDSLAHTYLGFGVRNQNGMEYFGVSVEIRCEPNEFFSPVKGLYKQYEIMYTISDERDSIGYRTKTPERVKDRVYMYRCNATPKQVQDMFSDIAARVNRLEQRPEFYHTFWNNCTTNIVLHANLVGTKKVNYFAPRVVFPGYSAKTAYNLGIIGSEGESFEDLESRSRIDEIARKYELDENFSSNVRKDAMGDR